MRFTSFSQLLRLLVIAVSASVIAFLIHPYIGLDTVVPVKLFVAIFAAGAFVGGSIASLVNFGTGSGSSSDSVSIFIGNLPFKASQEDLREIFTAYGDVHAIRIMKDRVTRRPRGFAFIEMDRANAKKAIKGLNGMEFLGRSLRVSEGSERN